MNEMCDRCGPATHAVFRVARDGELYLCAHCTRRLWHALTGQGWDISSVGGSSRWTSRIGVSAGENE
jgi:NMD protein affecting ribosome stability and mRNA decay